MTLVASMKKKLFQTGRGISTGPGRLYFSSLPELRKIPRACPRPMALALTGVRRPKRANRDPKRSVLTAIQ